MSLLFIARFRKIPVPDPADEAEWPYVKPTDGNSFRYECFPRGILNARLDQNHQ